MRLGDRIFSWMDRCPFASTSDGGVQNDASMARIAVIGPGAIGGIMAAWLGRSGVHEVIVCSRRPLGEFTVETPKEVIVARPRVITSPREAPPVDWVLVATKAYNAAATAEWLRPLTAGGAPIAVLQNGVEHRERFSPYLPWERIVPVLVYCPAERPEPARMLQRRAAKLVFPDTPPGRGFGELFAGTGVEIVFSSDITTALWEKLVLNSGGVLTALVLQPNGIFHDLRFCELARDIMRECIAVGRAEGAVLDDGIVERCIEVYRREPRDGLNSLHADRLAGRPMEIDARNGAIVRLGRKHGIPTPCNRMAVIMLELLSERGSVETKPAAG
jgi:2-dehydropantoate 2-reductase